MERKCYLLGLVFLLRSLLFEVVGFDICLAVGLSAEGRTEEVVVLVWLWLEVATAKIPDEAERC